MIGFSFKTVEAQIPAYCDDYAEIYAEVAILVDDWEDAVLEISDPQEMLEVTEQLQADIAAVVEGCNSTAVETSDDIADTSEEAITAADGSLENPFPFGEIVDSRKGFSIEVIGFVKPADRAIQNANMFNERPEDNEDYVLVNIRVNCFEDTPRCETQHFDYELVGDLGIVYSYSFVVYEDLLEISLLGGTSAEGTLVYLTRADDTNLRVLFRPNIFGDDFIAMNAEPPLGEGIQVVADNNINIRSGPSTNFAIVGSLPAGTPAIARGRNEDGTWVQIPEGWLSAELVQYNGDLMTLPLTSP